MTISVILIFLIFLLIFVFSGHAGGQDPEEPFLPSTPRAEEECRRSSSAANNAPLSSSYSIGASARLFLQCIHR